MFKSITTLMLLVAFMAQTFSGVVVILNYYTNTAEFAKNCENKARPQLHCKGKCQMMKQLQEEEKKEQNSAERKIEIKTTVLSSKSFYPQLATVYTIAKESNFSDFISSKPVDIATDFFHPPSV